MKPTIRAVNDGIVYATVDDITMAMSAYEKIRFYSSATEDGTYALVATLDLVDATTGYAVLDTAAAATTWYTAKLYDGDADGDASTARQNNTKCAYISAFDVRQELLIADAGRASLGPESEHALWEMAVDASRVIDQYKGVEAGSYNAATDSTRYYSVDDTQVCQIDPAVTITSVSVEETTGTYTAWTLETAVFKWPAQASAMGEPVRALVVSRKSNTTKYGFTAGQQTVKVVAAFGVSSTPPGAVTRAARILCGRWYKKAQGGYQDALGMPELGVVTYTKEMEPEAAAMLKRVWPRVRI